MSRRPAIDRGIDETEHLWIGMPDGVRLAARLWLPREAARRPVPALLEYIPYRKGDMVRARDERYHPYFAAHGYACLRVDMRGSGDSEGRMTDMYTPEELSDARHVIDWIASRPWCSGSVGMFGKSWGGTASLQASVDAPEALKAVIAVCATHDRYEDDIHHMGGCLLTDSVEWGATLPAILASPPGAGTVGPGWRALWEDRLAHLAFPLEPWVREEARTAYWRRGSVRFEADRIACPILAIGGWADRYSSSVMSLVDRRPDRVWGIVGPWGHQYPDTGHPGPAAGFQQLALEWWDHWLKTPRPPRPPWPPLRVWLRGFDPPADAIDRRNGEWIESKSPAAASTLHAFHLDRGRLRGSPPPAASGSAPMPGPELAPVPDDLRAGLASGDTGYFGRFGGLPLDQGPDDARSLVYETAPLREAFTLFGAAELMLEVVASRPLAQLSVRIGDVAPDGRVCRVGLALRNLALDDDPERDVAGARPGTGKIRIRLPHQRLPFRRRPQDPAGARLVLLAHGLAVAGSRRSTDRPRGQPARPAPAAWPAGAAAHRDAPTRSTRRRKATPSSRPRRSTAASRSRRTARWSPPGASPSAACATTPRGPRSASRRARAMRSTRTIR